MAIKNKEELKNKRADSTNSIPPSMNNIVSSMIGNQVSTLIDSGRVSITDSGLDIAGFNATPAGLIIPDNLSVAMLDDVIEVLFSLEGTLPILIGDALNAAESLNYGDISAIAEHFGREPKTLFNWKTVCKSVKSSLRRELWEEFRDSKPLSIGHYSLIQALDDEAQKFWIRQTYENGYSIARLDAAIKEAGGDVKQLSSPLNLFASKETRRRINRVWRLVETDQIVSIKQDDISLLRDWLNQLEQEIKSSS